jgi:hypothetical protein
VGLPVCVRVRGVVTFRPTLGGFTPPSSGDTLALNVDATYDDSKATGRTVTENVGAPYVVPLEGIGAVRFFAIKVRGGNLTLLLTSAAGTDQAMMVSDEFEISCPAPGTEYTAIKMYAPAQTSIEVRYLLSGNAS